MTAHYRTKQYIEGGYYHLYNRGVEKRNIFLDQQDYSVFLSYLKSYLLPKDENELRNKLSNPNINYKERAKILKALQLNNFFGEITLIAYCLMPNHFHFFVKQNHSYSIDKFMQSFLTRYVGYFNRKYGRVGGLCQDVYKAVSIDHEAQFIYLSKYIHKQAFVPQKDGSIKLIQPSSLEDYLQKRHTEWVHPEEVLDYFSKINPNLSYEKFVKSDVEENLPSLVSLEG